VVRSDVPERVPPPDSQHHFDLLAQRVRAGTVALIDDVDVCDLHHSGLQRLDAVARLRHEHEQRRLRAAGDVELGLAHAHRFHQDPGEPERLEQIGHFFGGGGQAAVRAPRGHRADEDVRIEARRFHPDTVAQQRAARERARGIDRHDTDRESLSAVMLDQPLGERALAGARGSGDADAPRDAAPELRVRMAQHPLEAVPLVLDERDRAGQRRGLVPVECLEDALHAHAK